ncbi:signal recognition particle-docking protein FtsY [Blattabacterium cuenoti]|uniref:signal recognition particle-docking protein FtsY n=1 Tax=Blattabacterium cuenoti TaxID=1653831 RepID=UPI00163BA3B7|nr:signal recognition particle-docking protein FtsY [Blattabacterium cuenoti]
MFKNYGSFLDKIKEFFYKSKKENKIINKSDIDYVEKVLLSADIGTDITIKIVSKLEQKIKEDEISIQELKKILKDEILSIFIKKKYSLYERIKKSKIPYVCMIVGVNGVGKTTTVGKLAFLLKNNGFNPIIGASDTFRECAIDQLEILANLAKVPLVKQQINSDPASVAYDTLQSAKSKKKDVVLIDTAGRLHNRVNLMYELSKIYKVMKKVIPGAPHETILILDANNGQNAIEQTKKFLSFSKVSCIILTKTEGTAKGGFIINIMNRFKIPIQYLGIGEKINKLIEFDDEKFVNDLIKF